MPALDGIRGVAVLLVLLDHASDQEMRIMPGADLNRLGKYGVYLFFVLSAFLLTYQLYMRRREEFVQPRTWMSYAARRFLRIFPVYTVVVLAMIAMEKLKPGDFWTHILLRDGRRVYWTIPVEVKFYIILPIIAIALFWAGRKHWLWGLAASVGGLIACSGLLWMEQIWSLHENVEVRLRCRRSPGSLEYPPASLSQSGHWGRHDLILPARTPPPVHSAATAGTRRWPACRLAG